MRDNPSCGVAIMEMLARHGTEIIFGIPGVHTVELYRGIAASGMRHVTPRHEQGAGFMADGYARATGKIGACCLITGPGLTNAATALAQSYSDSVPVLAVSSVNRTSSLGRGEGDLHELPSQRTLAQQVTASSRTVHDVNEVPAIMAEAYAIFDSRRPRPVHIEVPIDLLSEPVGFSPAKKISRRVPPAAPDSELERAAQMLLDASNPAVIFGGGCKDAYVSARRLVETLSSPTVLTFAAKGVVSAEHPLCAGSSLLHPPVLDMLKNADVVLAAGTELSETDIWARDGDIQFDGALIRIDIEPGQANANAAADLALIGDAGHALGRLADMLASHAPRFAERRERACELVRRLLEQSKDYWFANTPAHAPVLDVIREQLPDDGIVVADSTQIVYSGNFYYPARLPRTYLTSTTGYGTLGYALPAAIGAKLGRPETPVVCIAGDGGFLFSIQELATAAEHSLPIVVVLWNNDAYGEIRDRFIDLDIPPVGVDLRSPDFLAVAKGFGCHARRVSSSRQLAAAIKDGLAADRPTVLEVRADASL